MAWYCKTRQTFAAVCSCRSWSIDWSSLKRSTAVASEYSDLGLRDRVKWRSIHYVFCVVVGHRLVLQQRARSHDLGVSVYVCQRCGSERLNPKLKIASAEPDRAAVH